MGVCCSSGRTSPERTPVYFYCSPVLEERMPLPFAQSTITTVSSGVLVDTNLDTSSPDTYRDPPPPLPYNTLVEAFHGREHEGLETGEPRKDSDGKMKIDCLESFPESAEKESAKSEKSVASTIEEDACPICLEEYDKENPRILTKCEHHFHLSCILEWMERSDTCPMCDKVVLSSINDFNTVDEEVASQPLPVEL